MIRSSPRLGLTLTLGSAQTLAWASSYYLPAILAVPMARELEISSSWVFAAFSVALLLTAMLGPSVGRLIDQQGGRGVLMASNAVLAFGLVIMALSQGVLSLMLAWLITGVGMAMGLYDAAFATLGRLLGRSARSSITGVTLLAGFASTIGWPLTALLENEFGWRVACGAWAILHIVIGLPLNARLPKAGDSVNHSNDEISAPSPERPRLAMVLLAYVFAAGWFVSTAMAAHLPRLLQETGVSLSVAVAAAALVGPAQVAARLGEFALLRHLHPLVAARVATTLHPPRCGTASYSGYARRGVCATPWRGQWHDDDCLRHAAAGAVWHKRVWPATRFDYRPGQGCASLCPAAVWPINRAKWCWSAMADYGVDAGGVSSASVYSCAQSAGMSHPRTGGATSRTLQRRHAVLGRQALSQ
ncbi:MFS transporter [Halomonas sp. KO116]|uniref:MFS transporter n=1 Tax=Halomonas sp. KO116 TaxID=1504981 RepID=UPI0004E46364|nr:MFS transporter [Halomonas sp. KO116]AJY50218.1 major facilitator superfamily MFS_1 [Halomonas sp. KO116]